MKIIISIILTIFLLTQYLFAQTDQSNWSELQEFSSDDYLFRVPKDWKLLSNFNDTTSCKSTHLFINAGQVAYPKYYNQATVFIYCIFEGGCRNKCPDLDSCERISGFRYVLSSYNPQYVFHESFKKDRFKKFKLKSGQTNYIYKIHYDDHEMSSNYSVSYYDLTLYSERSKTCYHYEIIMKYYGDFDDFDKQFKSDEFVRKVYSFFESKK